MPDPTISTRRIRTGHDRRHRGAASAGEAPGRGRLLRVDEQRAVSMINAAGSGTVLALLDVPADQRNLGLSEAMFEAVLAGILTSSPPAPDTRLGALAITFATVVPDLPALTDAERTLMGEWLTRSIATLQQP